MAPTHTHTHTHTFAAGKSYLTIPKKTIFGWALIYIWNHKTLRQKQAHLEHHQPSNSCNDSLRPVKPTHPHTHTHIHTHTYYPKTVIDRHSIYQYKTIAIEYDFSILWGWFASSQRSHNRSPGHPIASLVAARPSRASQCDRPQALASCITICPSVTFQFCLEETTRSANDRDVNDR